MNNQQTTDKAGTLRRRKVMEKETQSIYGLLAGSDEKGRGAMETAVYAACLLSVVAAIFQFIHQPVSDPFAGFALKTEPVPVVSHVVGAVWSKRS